MATTLLHSTAEGTRAEPRVASSAVPSGRLISLDIFRGITIAAMILVNNPGTWSAIYWPLRHAEWHGWTPTDLIFPFFLFIVGVSMVFSFGGRRARGATRGELIRHVLRRSLIIFAIGFFLAAFPWFRLGTVRIPGVLQRIAVVYLCASSFYLWFGPRARIAVTVALLLSFWVAMMQIPVPGNGSGNLTPDGNLAAFLDRKLMYEHLWVKHRWDPEGLLSTLPAIATALIGTFVGAWLRSPTVAAKKAAGLCAWGAAGILLGEIWGLWFPINKNLWTSSYVVFTGGFAMLLLGICYWLVEIRGWRKWGAPFVWFGSNAITVFALSTFVAKCSLIFKVNVGDKAVTWHALVYGKLFAPLAEPINASLLFASSYALIFLVLAWLLYRKRIFIKI